MSREIKFRAWHINDRVMTTVDELHFPQGGIMVFDGSCYRGWADKDFELMQYTGLLDKNGREIYEGDIVEVNYTVKYIDTDKQDEEHTAITRVYWNDFRASFALEFHKFANDDLYRFVRDKYAEVIGNIHDNPELLSLPTDRQQIPDGGIEE